MGANELVVDVAKIKRAAHNAIALNILTYTLPHDIEVYIEEVLDVFLSELGQKRLKDYLVYCLRELAVNAKKANTKRVYFESRGLDINDPEQYEEGMTAFKQDTMDNIAWYLQKQKEKGYYVKVIFQAKGPNIVLEVRNNVEINKKEYVRIHDKLARSRKYDSLEEAMQQVLDSSEGAGLGLVILVLNNEDLNQVTWEQRVMEGDPALEASQEIPDVDYAAWAELIGLRGIRLTRAQDIDGAWESAFSSDRPVIINAITDPNEAPLPPHITFEQAKAFAASVAKDPAAGRAGAIESLREKALEFLPGR